MIRGLAAAAAIAICVCASDANAQSFNCRYAKLPAEVAICNYDALSRADRQMAESDSVFANGLNAAALVARCAQGSWATAFSCARSACRGGALTTTPFA